MDNETQQTIEELERIWRARRQMLSERRPLPSFIRSIESTEAFFIIAPTMLPYKQVVPERLFSILNGMYRLRFQTPESIVQAIREFSIDPSRLDLMGQLRFVLNSDDPTPVFDNGRFPVGTDDLVPISRLAFTGESILAGVSGHTEIAELLVAEAFEALWRAAGATKRWEDRDVQDSIQLKSYGTATKVNLGFDPMQLLSSNVREYFKLRILGEERLGAAMVARSSNDNFEVSHDVVCALSFDELHLKVRTFNQRTGRPDDATIKFSVRTRDEAGRGIIVIVTELSIEKHIDFILGLIDTIGNSKEAESHPDAMP